jgi:hypothetical protein
MDAISSIVVRSTAVVALLFATACSDGPTEAPPGIQPQIANNTDAFSYQTSELSDVTGTWDYTWQSTGTVAKVTHLRDAGASGVATITISDAAGAQVYTGAFATIGEPLSSPSGVAGAWTITVTYSNYSNTQVNFAVAKQ